MVKWLKFRYRLWKLERERSQFEHKYMELIEAAKKAPKHPDEEDQLWAEFFSEKELFDEPISAFRTGYWMTAASRLMVPIPDRNEEGMWEKARLSPRHEFLTIKGIAEIRSAIRKERRESREPFVMWASLVIGIIGALTGLVSILAG